MFVKVNRAFVIVLVASISILAAAAIIAAAFFLSNYGDECCESVSRHPIGTVVFVRHGESEWNSAKLYTGWYDAMLTETGQNQAKLAGNHLNAMQIQFDFVHTSLLTRAIDTTELILSEMPGLFNGTINTNRLLNERHCGALTGESKLNSTWTTHWSNRPPPMLPGHPYYSHIYEDPRYQEVVAENGLPNTESLADAQQRFIQHWLTTVGPQVQAGGRILLVAHQNLLRGVIKYFDQLPDAAACSLMIKNSVPFIYEFDENLRPHNKFAYLNSN